MSIVELAESQDLNVTDENGVLYLNVPSEIYFDGAKQKKAIKNYQKFLRNSDYTGSYGIRPIRKNVDNS